MRHLTTVQQKLLARWQDAVYYKTGKKIMGVQDLEGEQLTLLKQISDFSNLWQQVNRFLKDRNI